MAQVGTIGLDTAGLDTAENVFRAHGADACGRGVFSKRLGRAEVLTFIALQPPCELPYEPAAVGCLKRSDGWQPPTSCLPSKTACVQGGLHGGGV